MSPPRDADCYHFDVSFQTFIHVQTRTYTFHLESSCFPLRLVPTMAVDVLTLHSEEKLAETVFLLATQGLLERATMISSLFL